MQPVSQSVNALDLQKLRQQNEEALQNRATTQLGSELKTASGRGVSHDEKLVAGQKDQVAFTTAGKTSSSTSTQPPSSSLPADPKSSSSSSTTASETASSSSSTTTDASSSSEQQTTEQNSSQEEQKPLYSDSQQAFIKRLQELEDQRKALADMWRKMYMDFITDQLKAAEELENFRQSTALLWTDVATSRWIQGARQSEAVRSLL